MQIKKVIPTAGVVVFNESREVLLVEHLEGATHLSGVFGIPAGRLGEGEAAITTARRELREESGLVCTSENLIHIGHYQADIERKDGIATMPFDVYLCKKYSGEIQSSDETRPKWLNIDTLNTLRNILPNTHKAINDALQYKINSNNS